MNVPRCSDHAQERNGPYTATWYAEDQRPKHLLRSPIAKSSFALLGLESRKKWVHTRPQESSPAFRRTHVDKLYRAYTTAPFLCKNRCEFLLAAEDLAYCEVSLSEERPQSGLREQICARWTPRTCGVLDQKGTQTMMRRVLGEAGSVADYDSGKKRLLVSWYSMHFQNSVKFDR